MTADILSILQWAIPSGGIGAAIAWIVHRSAASAKDAKVVHDTYKQMYKDISAELEKMRTRAESLESKINKLTNENDELRRAVNRLRNTLVEIKRCPHYSTCPVRNELQDGSSGDTKSGTEQTGGGERQRKNTKCDDGNKCDAASGSPGHS